MPSTDNIFFNAHHAPIGGFATFTLGFPGRNGGLGLELGTPAEQNVYIGVETREGGHFQALPFYEGATDEAARYDVEKSDGGEDKGPRVTPFSRSDVQRRFDLGTDAWAAGDLEFTVYNQVRSIPDPTGGDEAELRDVLVPGLMAELTIDNTAGQRERTAFVGYSGSDPYSNMRRLEETTGGKVIGIGQGLTTAMATRPGLGAQAGLGFNIEHVLEPEGGDLWNRRFGLGGTGALLFTVPAGEKRTFPIALCFHRGGIATAGMDCRYLHNRYFDRIEAVASHILGRFEPLRDGCVEVNRMLDREHLSDDQRFMMAHAIKAYYASTQLLERDGQPVWVVNEGEYRMMNTFDLTVDHLYFEMKMNPWVVRNTMDLFVDRYSYFDQAHLPGGENEHPGGRSFTHDMGVGNVWSMPEHSSYELRSLDGCFSHMTHEQLVNWVCSATVYLGQTGDWDWGRQRAEIFAQLLESMVNRDHPDPARRTGIMGLDSSRTGQGAEITTYDSLDVSLGQSRNNLYLAVKSWAAYVNLAPVFERLGRSELAEQCLDQARRCVDTLKQKVTAGGYIPAVIDEGNDSKIVPAIEGLMFPVAAGHPEAVAEDGPWADLVGTLKTHLGAVLQPGVCLFDDGAWKISSTSDNAWLSKIYLCQHIARKVLGLPWDEAGAKADAGHVKWLLHPELSYWSWSDQVVAGEIRGSKYYPRGVTCVLWLDE